MQVSPRGWRRGKRFGEVVSLAVEEGKRIVGLVEVGLVVGIVAVVAAEDSLAEDRRRLHSKVEKVGAVAMACRIVVVLTWTTRGGVHSRDGP